MPVPDWILHAAVSGMGTGLVVGLVTFLLMRRAQLKTAQERDQARTELAEAHTSLAVHSAQMDARQLDLADRNRRITELESERSRHQTAFADLSLDHSRLQADRAALIARLEELRHHADAIEHERLAMHERSLAELRQHHAQALIELKQAFSALSAEALQKNSPEFLRLTKETLAQFNETTRTDLALREERLATLVKPLEEHLRIYQERLQQGSSQQSALLGEVQRHIEQLARQNDTLANETQRLRLILSSSQARGRWGEETLRRVVEAAGMSPHCDFDVQVQDADKRPDLLIRLPGDRLVIIDAKVPDIEFLDSLQDADIARRRDALVAHARKLRDTIRALADRRYPDQFPNALREVILFLPAESLFSAALEGDPNILVWAAERSILLATPASLIALLRAVSLSWQQHEQSQNAREIILAARQLHERILRFIEHFGRIRESLVRANKAYDDAVGSFDRMVRPAGERLERLGGSAPEKPLPTLPPIEATLRPPPTPPSP